MIDIEGLHDYFHWQYNIKETQDDDQHFTISISITPSKKGSIPLSQPSIHL
jgi:hypothetical protein